MSQSEPDLPKDPAEYRPRPLMGVSFWAMIAFGMLCVLAGAGVASLAPRLLPAHPAPAAPQPVAPTAPPAAVAPSASTAPAALSPPEEVARLNARIAALESQGARSSEAAAAALAAAELVDASQSSRPFAEELVELRKAAPELPELAALARLAETGAPSRAALAASFPEYAARAASRAHKPKEGAPLIERISYAAAKIVSVRRVEDVPGDAPDALLARAELALGDGEVVAALKLLDRLPPTTRKALAPWRAGAERRAEIDREVAALRARALRDLAPSASFDPKGSQLAEDSSKVERFPHRAQSHFGGKRSGGPAA
jgi:hypothetical protein